MQPIAMYVELGGPNAPTPVSEGVAGVLKVVAGLTPKDSGAFFNHSGAHVPW